MKSAKDKSRHYKNHINPTTLELLDQRLQTLMFEKKKFLLPNYLARTLAADLGTNTRYVSALIKTKYHTNFAGFINELRIKESQRILVQAENRKLPMEEVAKMVGFSNRQSFYTAFEKVKGCSPRAFKLKYMEE